MVLQTLRAEDTIQQLMKIPQPLPRHVIVNNHHTQCAVLNPIVEANTEKLTIVYTTFPFRKLIINWERFPKLKELDVTAYDICLKNIPCLEKIRIMVKNKDSTVEQEEVHATKHKQIMISDYIPYARQNIYDSIFHTYG